MRLETSGDLDELFGTAHVAIAKLCPVVRIPSDTLQFLAFSQSQRKGKKKRKSKKGKQEKLAFPPSKLLVQPDVSKQ